MTDHKKIDAHAGQKLKALRLTAGITQVILGREVGVTFQQVQKYERGISSLTAARLFQFARIFDVPVGEFFPEVEDMPREPIPPTTVRMLRYIRNIPQEFHEEVLTILRACARIAGKENADN